MSKFGQDHDQDVPYSVAPVAKAARSWSKYQTTIFDFIVNGTGNAIIEAVAGSGKSTTIVECCRRLPAAASSVLLAFNKAIAEELKAKGVNAKTFHSLTYSVVTRFKNTRNAEPNKLRMLVDANMKGSEARIYGNFVQKLVGLGRQSGIDALIPDTAENWLDLITYHDLELENEEGNLGRAIELASELLGWSNDPDCNLIDFDDMLYMPVKFGLTLPRFDFVFIDEAQDTNAIQRALLRKILKPTSRVIAVGDPAQAIYGFRGADSESMSMIAEEFDCVKLPLTVSYRCPQAVVRYAQTWVDHIEAAPGAPEGSVEHLGTKWKVEDFRAGDLVVCRTTKPLIQMAYKMLKARVPVRIMGKEIGQGMKALIVKMKATSIPELEERLQAWMEREVQKAIAKRNEAKQAAVEDKHDCIIFLADSLPEPERSIPALLAVIDSLFADTGLAVVLATGHKAKGMEADTVYWLNRSQCPSKWARQQWQKQQEANLCYVIATRAKKRLVTIEDNDKNEALAG